MLLILVTALVGALVGGGGSLTASFLKKPVNTFVVCFDPYLMPADLVGPERKSMLPALQGQSPMTRGMPFLMHPSW